MKSEETNHSTPQQSQDSWDKPSESAKTNFDERLDKDDDLNFTWEHFFSEFCGILEEDAVMYETNLIANRLSPLDVVFDVSSPSYDMIMKYGQFAIGDNLKVSKTISREMESIKKIEEELRNFKEKYDLKPEYSDFHIKMIHKLGKGDIRWGMDQLEEFMSVSNEDLDYSKVQNNQSPLYRDIIRKVEQEHEPARRFLRSFGYTTFDYTREKDIHSCTTHGTSSPEEPLLIVACEEGLNLTNNEPDVTNDSYNSMYL